VVLETPLITLNLVGNFSDPHRSIPGTYHFSWKKNWTRPKKQWRAS